MNNKGFTLVELSIVIIIAGFLIAGISAGKNLISQSKLQAVIQENNQYKIAINTFKLTYNKLPGDMDSATAFWPTQKNGNGNGEINFSWGSINTETIYFWGHLSNAGLIPGKYSGAGVEPGDNYERIGVNVPPSIFGSNSGWGVMYKNFYPTFLWPDLPNRHYLLFGSQGHNMMAGIILTPSDANSIDRKIDDGFPNTGQVVAVGLDYSNPNCSSSILSTANYVMTDGSIRCSLGFAF